MKTRTIVAVLAVTAMLGMLVAAGNVGAGPRAQSGEKGGALVMALAVPALISYQGRLLDGAGDPVADGPYTMIFRLYDVATGGAPLWTETKSVTVAGGLFTTLLGDTTALDLGIFDGRDLWLGVQVGADPEMTPRQRIVSVPYAIFSQDADTLDGSHASAFAPTTHHHDDRYVNTDGDLMRGDLDHAPVLDVANAGSGYGVSGYSDSNIGVYGGSGAGSGLLGISGLVGVYGNGEDTGVVGAGQSYGVRGSGPTGVRGASTPDAGGTGVWGESSAGTGVLGEGGLQGVRGDGGNYGVYGYSENGVGLYGSSVNGGGIYATGREGVRARGNITGVTGIGLVGVHGAALSTATVGGVHTAAIVTGVLGEAPSGIGVNGIGNTGVQGDGTQKGVYGVGTDYTAIGVEGRAGFGTGVKGFGETGVFGESSVGVGVEGRGATGVSGRSTIGVGVSGVTESASGAGVYARGRDSGADLILGGNADTLLGDDGRIYSDPTYSSSDIYLIVNDGVRIDLDEDGDGEDADFEIRDKDNNLIFNVDESGDTWARGSKGAVVLTEGHGMRALYALESTGVWFEDFGKAQIKDGLAVVEIDPLFAETVNLEVGYHVFLTPVGGWAPLYVVNQTPTSFEVRDASGKANITFDYRIVARRRGYENVRMEEVGLVAEED
ncbi:MAG: hypothetical protein ACE5LU_02730 [Anaerolineae bacterium]